MKSKRIACIAMAGLMAASLAGCGGSDSDNKDTTEATKATTEATGSDSFSLMSRRHFLISVL